MELHIKKINNNVIINETDFYKIIQKLKELEDIKITDDNFDELIYAANTSIDFWDNDIDDEVWNNA